MENKSFLSRIRNSIRDACMHLIAVSNLEHGQIIVVGCSSSEVQGEKIGSTTNIKISEVLLEEICSIVNKNKLYLAVQCCEHLNRCLVVEKSCAEQYGLDVVNVVPHLKAGGGIATAAYNNFKNPVIVEKISAHAGIDIGDTFIGMHLRPVAVPVRCQISVIGSAHLTMARTRLKMVGGERAKYR
jgi:uncharacterized protein (TIGR01440 family)